MRVIVAHDGDYTVSGYSDDSGVWVDLALTDTDATAEDVRAILRMSDVEADTLIEQLTRARDEARGVRHEPLNWFTEGVYPSCTCGFNPMDNRALIEHWSAHGTQWVDNHGMLEAEL
jgi:hypothetical protein